MSKNKINPVAAKAPTSTPKINPADLLARAARVNAVERHYGRRSVLTPYLEVIRMLRLEKHYTPDRIAQFLDAEAGISIKPVGIYAFLKVNGMTNPRGPRAKKVVEAAV